MRFTLGTLFIGVTLCAVEAALLATRSVYALLPASLLGTVILYLPVVWVCNHWAISHRWRRMLLALTGGLVCAFVLTTVAILMPQWR